MYNYAVYDGSEIVNIIVADSLKDAEDVSGMQCFDLEEIKKELVILEIQLNENDEEVEVEKTVYLYPGIGWKKINNEWVDNNGNQL